MKTVSIDELAQRIRNGETREALKEEYNMNAVDFSAFKNHPKIKGLKTGVAPTINFVEGPVEVDYKDHPGAAHVTDAVTAASENTEAEAAQ